MGKQSLRIATERDRVIAMARCARGRAVASFATEWLEGLPRDDEFTERTSA
jgi:hypothetical protein